MTDRPSHATLSPTTGDTNKRVLTGFQDSPESSAGRARSVTAWLAQAQAKQARSLAFGELQVDGQ
jgi:hypothetical protein